MPATWKSGATASSTSSRSRLQASVLWKALATRFRWVSTTPLDRPVVPPVKKIAAGSSSDVAIAAAVGANEPAPTPNGELGSAGRTAPASTRLVLGTEADRGLHHLAQRPGIPIGQEEAGPRAAQRIEQLGLGMAGVEGHDDEARGRHGEVGLHVAVAAGRQDGHAVTVAQPHRREGAGQSGAALVEGRVVEALLAADDGGAGARGASRVLEGRGRGQHRALTPVGRRGARSCGRSRPRHRRGSPGSRWHPSPRPASSAPAMAASSPTTAMSPGLAAPSAASIAR